VASTLMAQPIASSRSQPADTILLVEDDRDIAGMYRHKLQYDGYRVHVAMTGEMALALAFHSCADLVLLDMGLPTMDGLQVLAELRADRRTFSLPVVILSNYDDPDLIGRGLQLGAIDYLIKSQITPGGVSVRIAGWMAAQAACDARIAWSTGERARSSRLSAPCHPELELPPSPERGARFDVCRRFPVSVGDRGRGRPVA
jgi:PleD family two-component response regulator